MVRVSVGVLKVAAMGGKVLVVGSAMGTVEIDATVPFTAAPDIFAMTQRGGTDWLGIVFTWDEGPCT